MNPAIGLALLFLGNTAPGTSITVKATCTYSTSAAQISMTASKCVGVVSPIASDMQNPIYLAGGYKRTVEMPDGTYAEQKNSLADGLLVRFLHKTETGDYVMLEGIQLSDGRVLVDGEPVERTD